MFPSQPSKHPKLWANNCTNTKLSLSDLPWSAFSRFFVQYHSGVSEFASDASWLSLLAQRAVDQWKAGVQPCGIGNWFTQVSISSVIGIQYSGWWFQIFFSFTSIWVRFSFYKQTAQSRRRSAGLIENICIYIYMWYIYIHIWFNHLFIYLFIDLFIYLSICLYRPLSRTPQDSSKRRIVQKSTWLLQVLSLSWAHGPARKTPILFKITTTIKIVSI